MANDAFRALAHPLRRDIVERLSGGSATVAQVTGDLGVSKPTISRHLRVLEEAGVIERRAYQDHPTRYEYALTDSGVALVPVLDALLAWGLEHAVAQDDPNRMRRYPTQSERLAKTR